LVIFAGRKNFLLPMTISYKWLLNYLPTEIDTEKLSYILNAIGLEVERMEKYESVKGLLAGLLIGEVLTVEKHPNADKLSLTTVNIGSENPLHIVCGAPNVAVGQKVIVAPVGTTIYPTTGDPLTMRLAKIRGYESEGMICAEDEIGLGNAHAGILILPADVIPGTLASDYFSTYTDVIFEIGLTPNRSDAMSHLGVARDICAYLTHHENKHVAVVAPYPTHFAEQQQEIIQVKIENTTACERYSGISIADVTIKPSPDWLVQKLKSIGVRPINNVVDVTNFVLHETGQPLHAFDADTITGKSIIVKNLPTGFTFISLDEKERKLHEEDLMICDGESNPLCLAGVFGGASSGVSNTTTNLFLEAASFNAGMIRKTSFRHHLRTDAATHFEKIVDISNTVQVLKRAAHLILEVAGGNIASSITDVYPQPLPQKKVSIRYAFLEQLSGKHYPPTSIKKILGSLGFGIVEETTEEITLTVPFHKTDINLPADLAEEIMRIDGFDNIEIPTAITITPAVETKWRAAVLKEKVSVVLTGLGFNEIMNNSITNSAYLAENEKATAVKMMNNLSAELDVLRTSMLEPGMLTILHNINRKNNSLSLFEFGKTYCQPNKGVYQEEEHLALFITGKKREENWHIQKEPVDIYYIKGLINHLLQQIGLKPTAIVKTEHPKLDQMLTFQVDDVIIAYIGKVNKTFSTTFDIKQEVFYADLLWEKCMELLSDKALKYHELPKYQPIQRDLAFVIDSNLPYSDIETTIQTLKISKLKQIKLFDVFESEKLGKGKKSMALNFTFVDEEKTMMDKEIDQMMQTIIKRIETNLSAEIRKA
jgi:phenylalanyl-tRNA synthetase beta chain